MKFEYKKKYKDELKFSPRQLEQMSALHVVNWFLDTMPIEKLHNINPEWIKQRKWKDVQINNIEELKKNGVLDYGRIKMRKTKKGYILEMKFNWRSKGMKTTPISCIRCKKIKGLNWHYCCKKCTKEIGGAKGIYKFWRSL